MGNFYSNIAVKSTDLDALVKYINVLDYTTLVSAADNGFTCVFPWDQLAVFDIANDISKHFSCITFAALNHDDDVLLCKLYDSGILLDDYNSTPEFFGTGKGPQGGDAAKLVEVFRPDADPSKVRNFLSKKYPFATARHTDLARELGIPAQTVGNGYEYIMRGDCDVDEQDTIRTGSGKDVSEGGTMMRQAAAQKAQHQALHNLAYDSESIEDLISKTQLQAQEQLKSVKETLVTGTAGGDAVVISSRGLLIETVNIKDEALNTNDPHELEDLLVIALNDCANKVRANLESVKSRMLENVRKQLG